MATTLHFSRRVAPGIATAVDQWLAPYIGTDNAAARAVQVLLDAMMVFNLPLVVLTDVIAKDVLMKVQHGSPIVLFDNESDDRCILAVAAPMGIVRTNPDDFLTPRPMMDALGLPQGGMNEVVLRVLAAGHTPLDWFNVEPTHTFHRSATDGTVHDSRTFDFNWQADKEGHTRSVSTYFASTTSALFGRPLVDMTRIRKGMIHDFEARLAVMDALPPSLAGFGKKGRRTEAQEQAIWETLPENEGLWLFWRRALVFKMALYVGDRYGYAHTHLRRILPPCMLPGPPAPSSVTTCPMLPINMAALSEATFEAEVMTTLASFTFGSRFDVARPVTGRRRRAIPSETNKEAKKSRARGRSRRRQQPTPSETDEETE